MPPIAKHTRVSLGPMCYPTVVLPEPPPTTMLLLPLPPHTLSPPHSPTHRTTPQNKLDAVGEAVDGEAQALDAKRTEAPDRGACVRPGGAAWGGAGGEGVL